MTIKTWTHVTAQTPRFVCVLGECRFTELYQHPFLEEHIIKIKNVIAKNNAQALEDLLTHTMQNSAILMWKQGSWGKNDDYHILSDYYVDTCSVVEGLLRSYSQELSEIVKLIADQNNEALYKAFLKSIEQAALSEDTLFAWNQNLKHKLETSIFRFKKYATEKLAVKDAAKAEAVNDITTVVTEKIKLLEERSYNDLEGCSSLAKAPHFLAKLRTLQFKLEVNAVLHSKDHILKHHRSYARFASNIFSILFTGGILNVVNYAVNRRFWFFSQTRTQGMVDGIEKVVLNKRKFSV